MKPIILRVSDGKGRVVDHKFTQDSIMIGSGASAHLQLEGDGISSLHAMIKIEEDGKVYISDLGTETGTFIGKKQIMEESELPLGSVVKISDIKIFFLGTEEEAAKKSTGEKLAQPAVEGQRSTSKHSATPSSKKGKSAGEGAKGKKKGKETGAVDLEEMRYHEQPEIFKGKVPPMPELPPPKIAELTESNKRLEVSQFWGKKCLDKRRYKPSVKAVRVSTNAKKKAEFYIPNEAMTTEIHVMASSMGNSISVTPIPGGRAYLLKDGNQKQEINGVHTMGLKDAVKVELGSDISFMLRYVPNEKPSGFTLLKDFDFTVFNSLMSSFVIVILGIVAAILFAPKLFEGKEEGVEKAINRFIKLVIKEEVKEEKKIETKKEIKGEASKTPSNIKDANPNKTKIDREKALNAGILGALQGGGAVSNVFGAGGLGVGITSALGGLHGTRMGAAGGLGGLGSRGAGAGGGGSAVGIGGIGLSGGYGKGGGYGAINLGGTGKKETQVSSGHMILQGGLEKDVIEQVVRRHMNQIKYCYEKELAKNPNLWGKVAVNWTIGPDGGVQDARIAQSEMNDVNVEDCLIRNIRRWKFPNPKGGGIVVVTYPFIFKT